MEKLAFTTVADVMTRKLVTVTEEDLLENLEESMQRLRFRHLPVVDKDNTLVGIVSHGDLRHASSSFLSDREADRNAIIRQLPVGRIMQRDVLTVQATDPLVQAGKLLWESKIGCLPVVDPGGALVGIITKADFIRTTLLLLGSDVPSQDVEELASRTAHAPS
jgi:CBS domain-containing protein